jgi:hypothetical protein
MRPPTAGLRRKALVASLLTLVTAQQAAYDALMAALETGEADVLHRRRGGWHPKPRLHELYNRPMVGRLAWDHDASRSQIWDYINAPEAPYWDRRFMEVLGMPRGERSLGTTSSWSRMRRRSEIRGRVTSEARLNNLWR